MRTEIPKRVEILCDGCGIEIKYGVDLHIHAIYQDRDILGNFACGHTEELDYCISCARKMSVKLKEPVVGSF